MSIRPSPAPAPAPSPRPSPSILRRSGDVSTADKKPEETQELPRTPKVFKQIMLMMFNETTYIHLTPIWGILGTELASFLDKKSRVTFSVLMTSYLTENFLFHNNLKLR